MYDIYDINGMKYDAGGEIVIEPPYVTPEMYGAIGDGVSDDYDAVQEAVLNKGIIMFKAGSVYRITKTLRILKNTTIDMNGSTILCENNHTFFNFLNGYICSGYEGQGNITIKNGTIIGGCISFAHGSNILLDRINFQNTNNDHMIEICACENYVINECSFVGMNPIDTGSQYEYINIDPCLPGPFPWNTAVSESSFYDNTINDGITIENCYLSTGTGDYTTGHTAIGVHSGPNGDLKHKNIRIINNKIRGRFEKGALRINAMDGVYIAGNDIRIVSTNANPGDCVRVGDHIPSNDVVIINNLLYSSNGSRIALTNGGYTNLTVDNNSILGEIIDPSL